MKLFRHGEDSFINLDLATDFVRVIGSDGEISVNVYFAAVDSDGDVTYSKVIGEDASRLINFLEVFLEDQYRRETAS